MQNLQNLLKKHADKIRFVLVGGANTAIDMSLLFGLVNLFGLAIFYSNIISTSIALTFSYFVNKSFTFKDRSPAGKTQLLKFLAITVTGLWIIQPIIIATTSAFFYYSLIDSNIQLLVGKLAATCVTLVWNYLLYKKFVFKEAPKAEA